MHQVPLVSDLLSLELSLRDNNLSYLEHEMDMKRGIVFKREMNAKENKITWLKGKNGVRTCSQDNYELKKEKRTRRFIPRQKYKRKQDKKKKSPINLVTNLSSMELSNDMLKVLNKGLNYCVVKGKPNMSGMLSNFKQFERKLRWKEFFFDTDNDTSQTLPLFRKEKTNMPPNTSPDLHTFISSIRSELIGSKLNKVRPNLSTGEREALEELVQLQRRRRICIKPADKGSGIVIVNFDDYEKSCEQHLRSTTTTNAKYYEEISAAELRHAKQRIESVLSDAKEADIISNDEYEAMSPASKGPGRYYQLFKLHKPYASNELPPERPIISQSGSITEAISQYIDHHAKSLVPEMDSYIQDTPHFLRTLEEINKKQVIDDKTFPISLDVKGLYLNIPQHEGIESFRNALQRRCNPPVPTDFLIKLLTLVLQENLFEFGPRLFRQVIGTAMGTRVAPTFANLFMEQFDKQLYLISLNTFHDAVLVLKRFIDDLFMLWRGAEAEFLKFLETINSIHPTIKFTATYNFNEKSTTFLDTEVKIINGRLTTDLYRKKSDKVQYLLPSSGHPAHVTSSIPYSLCLRLVRICSEPDALSQRCKELRQMLLQRNYSRRIIDHAISKATSIPRTTALKKVEKQSEERVTFVVTYSPHFPSISNIIGKHWRTMVRNPEMKRIFEQPPMVAYKQPSNLKRVLCRARLPPPPTRQSLRLQSDAGLRKCLKPHCRLCIHVNDDPTIFSTSTRYTHQVQGKFSCETTSVVYIITCMRCDIAYIGQTGRSLRQRISEHLAYIPKKIEATGVHFNKPGHTLSDFRVQVIEHVKPASKHLRETREQMWIQRMGTRTPFGMNKRD